LTGFKALPVAVLIKVPLAAVVTGGLAGAVTTLTDPHGLQTLGLAKPQAQAPEVGFWLVDGVKTTVPADGLLRAELGDKKVSPLLGSSSAATKATERSKAKTTNFILSLC